ncbi:MAG: hypothetical protein M3Y56_04740 [Armatimonadota bacterium]|nr:hypothetical protein [Armatimonadota bacterium]
MKIGSAREIKMFNGCYTFLALIGACVWIWSTYSHHRGASLLDDGKKMMQAGDRASVQKAIQDFTDAAATFKGKEEEKVNSGICDYDLGLAYKILGEDQKALDSFTEAIPDLQGDSDQAEHIKTCNENIGGIHFDRGQDDSKAGNLSEAFTEYQLAIPAYQAAGDTENVTIATNNSGNETYNQGRALARKHDWKGAIDMFSRAQKAYHTGGKKAYEADCLQYLAVAYDATGDSTKAADARAQEQTLRGSIKGKS